MGFTGAEGGTDEGVGTGWGGGVCGQGGVTRMQRGAVSRGLCVNRGGKWGCLSKLEG